MSNDRHYYREGEEQLWRIAPGEAPREYTEADGWRPLQVWGMGIASQDLTDDGFPEVFLTSQGDNKLQTLEDGPAQPTYRDIALERGVTAQRPFVGGDVLPSTAWHPEFEDVNNDGFVDLFVSKGNVDAQSGNATRDPSNLLIGQSDGTFVEGAEAAGIVGFDRARGAALVDLNLDGMLDLVVVNRRVERDAVAQRRPAATPSDRRRWVTGSRSGSGSRLRTSMRSVRGSRCGWASEPSAVRSPSGVGTQAARSGGSMPASVTRTGPRSVFNGRTVRWDRG